MTEIGYAFGDSNALYGSRAIHTVQHSVQGLAQELRPEAAERAVQLMVIAGRAGRALFKEGKQSGAPDVLDTAAIRVQMDEATALLVPPITPAEISSAARIAIAGFLVPDEQRLDSLVMGSDAR